MRSIGHREARGKLEVWTGNRCNYTGERRWQLTQGSRAGGGEKGSEDKRGQYIYSAFTFSERLEVELSDGEPGAMGTEVVLVLK